MVASVFTLSALSFGTLGSVSVFLKPLVLEFGWTRAEASLGYTVISFSSAIFGILWGQLADRYGSRYFGFMASVAMSACLILLSEQSSLIQFYSLYFVFGALGNAMLGAPLYANVGYWFKQNPGLALGITAAGGAFGQGIVPMGAALLIENYGWQSAYLILGISYFLIGFPLAFLIKEPPARRNFETQQTTVDDHFPLRERETIIWVSCAITFCCLCMSVPIVHLVPLLTDKGFTNESASSVLMVLMFSGIFGRILGGKLGDMYGALPGYMMMSFGQTISVFWFPFLDSILAVYALAIFFGFTYSGVMSAILVCARTMVPPSYAARMMSITAFFGWGGMGMGGFVGGYLFDLQGNYFWSFYFATMVGITNLGILGLLALRIRQARVREEVFS